MVVGDGLEAIEEVAGWHALLASELEVEYFEPFVGGCDEEAGLLNEQTSSSSGARTTGLLCLVNFHVDGSC